MLGLRQGIRLGLELGKHDLHVHPLQMHSGLLRMGAKVGVGTYDSSLCRVKTNPGTSRVRAPIWAHAFKVRAPIWAHAFRVRAPIWAHAFRVRAPIRAD